MNTEEQKKITIYCTRNRIVPNKKAKNQMCKIEMILKGTPFEEYTKKIFTHLLIVQVLQHGDGAEIEAAIKGITQQLELVSTLLILQKATNLQIKCRYDKNTKDEAMCSDIPQELILPIKQAAIELYNRNLQLCMVPSGETWVSAETGKVYNKTKYQFPTRDYLYIKKMKLQKELSKWRNLKKDKGHPTYTKEHPSQLSPALMKVCAINIFAKCKSAFNESKWNTAKERNKIIFKCLEVMGIAPKGEAENNINKLIGSAKKINVSIQYMYKDREIEYETAPPHNIPFIATFKVL